MSSAFRMLVTRRLQANDASYNAHADGTEAPVVDEVHGQREEADAGEGDHEEPAEEGKHGEDVDGRGGAHGEHAGDAAVSAEGVRWIVRGDCRVCVRRRLARTRG